MSNNFRQHFVYLLSRIFFCLDIANSSGSCSFWPFREGETTRLTNWPLVVSPEKRKEEKEEEEEERWSFGPVRRREDNLCYWPVSWPRRPKEEEKGKIGGWLSRWRDEREKRSKTQFLFLFHSFFPVRNMRRIADMENRSRIWGPPCLALRPSHKYLLLLLLLLLLLKNPKEGPPAAQQFVEGGGGTLFLLFFQEICADLCKVLSCLQKQIDSRSGGDPKETLWPLLFLFQFRDFFRYVGNCFNFYFLSSCGHLHASFISAFFSGGNSDSGLSVFEFLSSFPPSLLLSCRRRRRRRQWFLLRKEREGDRKKNSWRN